LPHSGGDRALEKALPEPVRMKRRPAARALNALALAGLIALPAQAAFNVCNKGNLPARVALGHFDGKAWSSEGWWTIAPKSCAGLIQGSLLLSRRHRRGFRHLGRPYQFLHRAGRQIPHRRAGQLRGARL
jgi:hypothetical protein